MLVLCWRGGSFCLLRRLLSSIPPGSALEPDGLLGEPSRCCAGNGTGGFRRASLSSESATRPCTVETLQQEVGGGARSRVPTLARWGRGGGDAAQRSTVAQTRKTLMGFLSLVKRGSRCGDRIALARCQSHNGMMDAGQDFRGRTGSPA